MTELKQIIAKNINELRQERKLTQLEFANMLNYSDKAISKWEHAESIPDITILKQIADLFNVSVDYLLEETHTKPIPKQTNNRLHITITILSALLVLFIYTIVFVFTSLGLRKIGNTWLAYVYAVPSVLIVWLIFNSIWFNKRLNFLIISLLIWTFTASVHISFLPFGYNPWLLYIICIPAQIIIFVWEHGTKKKS